MSNVLIAWEIGDHFGHLSRDFPIAIFLRNRDAKVSFAVRYLSIANSLLSADKFPVFQAPVVSRTVNLDFLAGSFGEMLQIFGYWNFHEIAGQVTAWINLFTALDTHVVLVDFAPTALLAAHIAGIPTMLVGTGFEIPPPCAPFPWRLVEEPEDLARCQLAERRALDTVNKVLAARALAPLGSLSDLYRNTPTALSCFPELEHYAALGFRRSEVAFVGHIGSDIAPCVMNEDTLSWFLNSSRKKIFLYLRQFVAGLNEILNALAQIDAECLCYLPDATSAQTRFASTNLRFLEHGAPLSTMLDTLDLVVSYAGAGTVATTLLGGVPMLLVPHFNEQRMTASRVEAIGAGVWLRDCTDPQAIAATLERMLRSDDCCRLAAQSFQQKYQNYRQEDALEAVCATILQCANARESNLLVSDSEARDGAGCMSRVLFVRELGSDLGAGLGAFALMQSCYRSGAKVVAYGYQETAIKRVLGDTAVIESMPKRFSAPAERCFGHASVLRSFGGFFDAHNLMVTVRNWLEVFQAESVSIVVAEAAPAAMLAARILGIRRIALDCGQYSGPLGSAFPLFPGCAEADLFELRNHEEVVVSAANAVLEEFHCSQLKQFSDLFDADLRLLAQYAELDVFARDNRNEFVGPLFSSLSMQTGTPWSGERKGGPLRIVAKLAPGFSHSMKVLDGLLRTSAEVLTHLPSVPPKGAALHPGLYLLESEDSLDAEIAGADMVVCHGGYEDVNYALAFGKPILMIPMYVEQTQYASKVQEKGLGWMLSMSAVAQFSDALQEVLPRIGVVAANADRFRRENPLGNAWHVAQQVMAPIKRNVGTYTVRRYVPESIDFGALDFVFLSFDEPNADENFEHLRALVPNAKRVHGVKGFDAAHKAAADLATGGRFVTVDADTRLRPEFLSTIVPVPPQIKHSTWGWTSSHEVNGLCYGNGGVKIWHKDMIRALRSHENASGALSYDFCHHAGYRQFGKCYSTTHPNGSPFQAFRAGFREAVKLASEADGTPTAPHQIIRSIRHIKPRRLLAWMSVGADAKNGLWEIFGARLAFKINLSSDFQSDRIGNFDWFRELWDREGKPLYEAGEASLHEQVVELGDYIRNEIGFSILEDWDAQRSADFKARVAAQRPESAVFDPSPLWL